METRETARQALEARLDGLERRIDQLTDKTTHTSADKTSLSSLRARLSEARMKLRAKDEVEGRADDSSMAELGHWLNDAYEEMAAWPKGQNGAPGNG